MSKKVERKKVAPGTLQHIGNRKIDIIRMQLYTYNAETYSLADPFSINELADIDTDNDINIKWLNIYGLHDTHIIEQVGEKFKIDKMELEDLLNTTHRPKVEEFPNHLFFTLKILNLNKDILDSEQISIIISENFLVSFQEKIGDFFDHIRNRIQNNLGYIRVKKADFLFYLMLDSLLDNYYHLNDQYHELYRRLNIEVRSKPDDIIGQKIEKAKNDILMIRKTILPLKEAILKLDKGARFISPENGKYFSDLRDSVLEIGESFETLWQMLDSAFNLNLTLIGNKANDIMKVLTIIATIFIPLTFIAGVYGMNFKFLPELSWKYSYPVFWAGTIVITVGMIIYFRIKKWL